MHAVLIFIGVVAVLGFVVVGGPSLVDWTRKRKAQAVACQIALTDALDGQLGPLVAPVVHHPPWGPWEIRIAVPLLGPAALAIIVAAVEAVFTRSDGTAIGPYRLLLHVQDISVNVRESRWTDHRLAAT